MAFFGCVLMNHFTTAQAQTAKSHVLIDVSHGQKFWHDPSDMPGQDQSFVTRVKYMTGEITKTATSVGADIGYLKTAIKPADLTNCNLLFVHIPSTAYQPDEAKAIDQYVKNGGALFFVMDADYWSTLEKTKVNDILKPFGITFGADSKDSIPGGHTKPGLITQKKLKVTYHGARLVDGGTPFAFNDQTAQPFGTFVNYGKGKVVVMGDGMVSLYMTEWNGVSDYQCSEFMHDVFAFLLAK